MTRQRPAGAQPIKYSIYIGFRLNLFLHFGVLPASSRTALDLRGHLENCTIKERLPAVGRALGELQFLCDVGENLADSLAF